MIFRDFPKAKICVVHAGFPEGSKLHFAQWKPDFNEFIDKFLKFEEVQYQIRYIKSNLKV